MKEIYVAPSFTQRDGGRVSLCIPLVTFLRKCLEPRQPTAAVTFRATVGSATSGRRGFRLDLIIKNDLVTWDKLLQARPIGVRTVKKYVYTV